jgi:nucleotide-binding universal stress UspA family protein
MQTLMNLPADRDIRFYMANKNNKYLNMKTIIIATNFSGEAENALKFVGPFAKKIDAKVILFNTFNIPLHLSNSLLPASSITTLEEKNKALLSRRASKLATEYDIEVGFESRLMREVEVELEDLFTKYNADFIVMGMASRSVAQDVFGNTTTSAMMRLKFPVLAVPKGVSFNGMKKILFAYDKLQNGSFEGLDKIRDIAMAFQAEVEIFHVQNPLEKEEMEFSEKDKIEGIFQEVKHSYKKIDSGAVLEEIQKEIKATKADLLIMVPQKYGFWESFIHRSKTRVMASGSEIPLLSIPT